MAPTAYNQAMSLTAGLSLRRTPLNIFALLPCGLVGRPSFSYSFGSHRLLWTIAL
jgi:hypothetical protein